jgi:tetratricopeptide (TPR) repeat protein
LSERKIAIQKDLRDVPFTTSSKAAIRHFDDTVSSYLGFRRDTGDHLKLALKADPDFLMGHVTRGCFLKLFAIRALDERVDAAILAARKSALEGGATQRERDHLAALIAWHHDDWQGALELWEKILLDNPLDVLALKLANHSYFYLGDARNTRDSIARVLYAWNEDTPGHGFVLGMYAFGLEECGDYANAEAVGQQAVEINPADVWAIHAVVHVLEMQGRHREGTDWLKTSEKIWTKCNNFANHLWWHGALLLMDLERFHAVLDGYDNRIRVDETDDYLDVANAASLLWRLEEAGVDVGSRWIELADKAEAHARDHKLAFADAHYMMALAADGRVDAAQAMIGAMSKHGAASQGMTATIYGEIATPLCAAILAYSCGEFDRVVDLLQPLRYDLRYLGGSIAQRDVFHRMLISASVRSGRLNFARSLMSERSADRPTSVWNWRTYARVLAALDDESGAVAAWRKARDLVAGLTL